MNHPEAVMEDWQQGNEEAFEQIYTAFHRPVYAFIYRYTRDEPFSVDIVQDTFLRLQTHKHQYVSSKGTLKSYLFQIAYRLMVNKLNRRKKWRSLLPFLVPSQECTLHPAEKLTVQQAVSGLPDLQRAVILLYYYHDLPQKEIADILHIPLGTVKSRRHQAIQTLKTHLEVEDL